MRQTKIIGSNFPHLVQAIIINYRKCFYLNFQVDDVSILYDKLMNLLLKFANHGVIHGDYNEFNIMINDDGEPIIIDFPQVTSA